MAVCGSCGMRMDGGAVLGVQDGDEAVRRRRPRRDGVADGQPAGDQGPRRRHGRRSGSKVHAVKPYLDSSDVDPPEREWRVTPKQAALIRKESLCIMCGCCVSECNSMESDPDFLGPAALAKAYRFVGDVRDGDARNRLAGPLRRARHLGLHALLLLQPALPEGRRPARRDREARRGGVPRGPDARRGREARQGVRRLHLPGRLPARDRAGAEDDRPDRRDHADPVRPAAGAGRQGAEPALAAQGEGQRRGQAALEAARGADAHAPGTAPPAATLEPEQ